MNKTIKTNNSKSKHSSKKNRKQYQSNNIKNTKKKIIKQLGGTKTDVCEEMVDLKRFGTLDIFNYALQIPKLSNPSGFANTTLVNKNIQ